MKWVIGARASMTMSGSIEATVATLWTRLATLVELRLVDLRIEFALDRATTKTNQPAALPKKDDRNWKMAGWAGSRLENESHKIASAIDLLGNLILHLFNCICILPNTLLLPSLLNRCLRLVDRVTSLRRLLSAIR